MVVPKACFQALGTKIIHHKLQSLDVEFQESVVFLLGLALVQFFFLCYAPHFRFGMAMFSIQHCILYVSNLCF